MNTVRFPAAVLCFVCAAAPCAAAPAAPLDLQLPADNAAVDASDATGAAPVAATADGAHADRGAYPLTSAFVYEDPNPRNRAAPAARCDDATYNDARLHGSATVGVVGGRRVSGNYESGVVKVTKALGSCDDPGGVVSISIGVGKDHFDARRHGQH